jgi:hypothetical protein
VLESVPPEFRGYMIYGRNKAQQDAQSRNEHQNQNQQNPQNQKRNASATGKNTTSDDGPVGAMTIRNVQFDKDGDSGAGGASSMLGATGRKKRNIGAVVSSIQRIGKSIQIRKPTNYLLRARAEIDTRADTVCAGSTFLLHDATGKIVDVSGFHEQLEPIKNIQVGTCITAIDLNEKTIIASFPQSLYFGDTMETSLIPPAQLWHHGITAG